MDDNANLRQHLLALVRGGQAYESFSDALKEFSPKDRGVIPKGAEHSAWQILDHMVRTLEDIVEFSDNEGGKYKAKNWPNDYWSKNAVGDWSGSIRAYRAALKKLEGLVKDKKRNLFEEFPWGDGQTLLREVLLAADHQAYHVGELVMLKRWIDRESHSR